MPKIIDYPRASLKSVLELANAVDDFGGTCSTAMAAERLNRKVSGAFHALTSSASKYGLVDSKAQKLTVTNLYRDYKLSYTEEEKKQKLRIAVLSVPIFGSIYERFANKELPLAHFDKLLIREFNVPDDLGSRVASYFLEGAKEAGMLDDNNRLTTTVSASFAIETDEQDEAIQSISPQDSRQGTHPTFENDSSAKNPKNYFVRISGPGMDSNIEINELEDMLIVEAMLKKVEKALKKTEEALKNKTEDEQL